MNLLKCRRGVVLNRSGHGSRLLLWESPFNYFTYLLKQTFFIHCCFRLHALLWGLEALVGLALADTDFLSRLCTTCSKFARLPPQIVQGDPCTFYGWYSRLHTLLSWLRMHQIAQGTCLSVSAGKIIAPFDTPQMQA